MIRRLQKKKKALTGQTKKNRGGKRINRENGRQTNKTRWGAWRHQRANWEALAEQVWWRGNCWISSTKKGKDRGNQKTTKMDANLVENGFGGGGENSSKNG